MGHFAYKDCGKNQFWLTRLMSIRKDENNMDIKLVKRFMGKIVYYDTGQINIDGCSIQEFILTARILRKDKKNQFFYQAELKDTVCKNSVIIVLLEKVLTRDQI